MTPESLLHNAINPALRLLPQAMTSGPAKVQMIAIALQESRIQHRRQIGGPARGYWQFEQGGGVRGVLTHQATKHHIRTALATLDYEPEADSADCYAVIEHNDILAACFARLLLWTLPGPMPTTAQAGWDYYIEAWRPGKPHPETWPALYKQAIAVVAKEA